MYIAIDILLVVLEGSKVVPGREGVCAWQLNFILLSVTKGFYTTVIVNKVSTSYVVANNMVTLVPLSCSRMERDFCVPSAP